MSWYEGMAWPFGVRIQAPVTHGLVDRTPVEVKTEHEFSSGRAHVRGTGFVYSTYGEPTVQVEFDDEPGTFWWVKRSECTPVNDESPQA